MSITPVFDQTVAASDADLHKASNIFPQPSTHWAFAGERVNGWGKPHYIVAPNPVDSPAREPWTITPPENVPSLIVKSKPEPRWRTFLRCLLWWLP